MLYATYMFTGEGHVREGLWAGLLAAALAGTVIGLPTACINHRILASDYRTFFRYSLLTLSIVISFFVFILVQTIISLSLYFPWGGP
jgi:hypothetical protein